jgi:RND superfamily putative drug exporter
MAVLSLVFVAIAGVIGAPAAGMLKARNPFDDPASSSSREQRVIERATSTEENPGVLALVAAAPGAPTVSSAAREIAAVPGVVRVSAPLASRDGRASLLAVTLRSGRDPDGVVGALSAALHDRRDVTLGGSDVAGKQVSAQASKDLGFAELLAFPLLALIAWLVFRGVAALLPVAVGGVSVLGAFLALRLVNAELSLSSFALNLVIGLGLGLAVDYSLLLVWRFREELGRGADVPAALTSTLATAGRTIVYSAVTVAAAMLTLTLFPQRFLVSMGIGGAATALVSGAAALLVVPALLVLLAGRIGRAAPAPEGTGRWYRLAQAVMKRPALVALAASAALLVVASPALGVRWSGIDATVLPGAQSARIVSDAVAHSFPAQRDPATIAARAPAFAGRELTAYAERLRTVPGVAAVGTPHELDRSTWQIGLELRGDPIGRGAQATIGRIRALRAPAPVLVGGAAAKFADQRSTIAAALPLALAVLAAVTLLILWLMTGSIVLPLKALLMNAITVASAAGALVFVFQAGRLTGLLAYTSQGGIEQTDFLVLAAIAFALSTDYGVLLMTRVKEARDAGRPNREAIATGLEHTGRLVSASALLMVVAIGAFATSQVVFLKEIGIGAVVAVLVDAFIVRALLVPSLMALLGERNWWSPRWLVRLHGHIGLSEGVIPAPARISRALAVSSEP